MSNKAVRVVGFLVAGGVLVAIADAAPNVAIGAALVIGLGVVLSHPAELQALSDALVKATGH